MFGFLRWVFGRQDNLSEQLVSVDIDGRRFMVQLEVAAEIADLESRLNEAADMALTHAHRCMVLADMYGKPVAWFEAEPSARGADLRDVMWGMAHSSRLSRDKPDTTNPVWEIYGREL